MQNISPSFDLLKLTINQATQFLKEGSFEPSTKGYWLSLSDTIIRELDTNKDKLYLLKEILESLAALLLFRITTRLGSAKLPEIYQSGREILKRLRTISPPRAMLDSINEFLLTPAQCFNTKKVDQEVELLYHQVHFLQEIMQKEKDKAAATYSAPLMSEPQPEMFRQDITMNLFREADRQQQQGYELSDDFKEEERFEDEVLFTPSPAESSNQEHSLCLLDLEGNFIMTDKAAEDLFEKDQTELLGNNLFNIMIPFSAYHLKKKLGSFVFQSTRSQAKTFSYTIYSQKALKKYLKIISNQEKLSQNGKKKNASAPKFCEDEKKLLNEANSTYYKYLQTLTSCATLINIKFSSLEDIKKLEEAQGVKVNTQHKLFKRKNNENEDEGFIAVLLLTRKAKHVQKFRYSLMKEYDKNIIEMEKSVNKKISIVKEKIENKDKRLNEKRALMFEGDEQPGKKKVK